MKYLCIFGFILVTSTSVMAIRRIADGCYVDCTALYAPVCGSDGNTYNNECELLGLAGCRNTPDLTKVKDRPCDVGTVVLLDSFEWDLKAPRVKLDAKSALTINIIAKIAKGSDSLSGKNLWKVGIFGSEWEDGFGEKYGYVEQILIRKQASKRVKKGKVLKLKNLRARFDLSRIGCDRVAYFCVELARDRDSSVHFELRAGILLDSIVACKRFDCQRPNATVDRRDLPPTCFEPCPSPGGAVCGSNSVQYDSFCELTKAARCQRVSVKLANLGECPPEIVISGVFWTALARPNPDSRIPLLSNDLYIFNAGSDIIGTDLWQVSLFGSANENGTGFRHLNADQVLDSALSSQPLTGGLPFNLQFIVPFNTYAVGCEEVPYFCLEFKRNPNASIEFVMKKTSGESVILSCRNVPCLTPPSDKVRLYFQQVRWNVLVDNFRFNEPSDLSLNISVDVQPKSEELIGGHNLWRIGIYGSRDPGGDENQKIGFLPQVLGEADAYQSPDIIPGQTLVFPLITTEFDISAIGCGDYRYLCVVLAKGSDSEPDFEISNNKHKRKIISCRQVQCISQEALPPAPPTALLSYLTWNMTVKAVREDQAYNITLAVNVVPSADTDTIQGTDLWRVGLFISNVSSGVMARSQYQADILTEEDKTTPLIQGQNLLLAHLNGVLNVDGVGCPGASLQYACLEFAKGASPEPYFHLPLGASNVAISCRRLYCHQTSSSTHK